MKHIYVVDMPDHPFCKVGMANNIQERMWVMKSHCPYEYAVSYISEEIFESHAAGIIEGCVHYLLSKNHHQGEWYRCSVDLAKQAAKQSIQLFNTNILRELEKQEEKNALAFIKEIGLPPTSTYLSKNNVVKVCAYINPDFPKPLQKASA